jgi:DNA-directed RNA polymerase specialized sigma24 family protein
VSSAPLLGIVHPKHAKTVLLCIYKQRQPEMTESELIHGCKAGDPIAQKTLYTEWSPLLFAVVRRYLSRAEDAEDVFVEGMFKILTKIKGFREEGSFEGWMKRIMVNEALMFLRKRHNFHLVREIEPHELQEPPAFEHDLHA